jgi:hypothetical protein
MKKGTLNELGIWNNKEHGKVKNNEKTHQSLIIDEMELVCQGKTPILLPPNFQEY